MKEVTNPRDDASCSRIKQIIVKFVKRGVVEDGSTLFQKLNCLPVGQGGQIGTLTINVLHIAKLRG